MSLTKVSKRLQYIVFTIAYLYAEANITKYNRNYL